MKTPKQYNISPAKGQALLNFQGRRYPDTMDVFETDVIEEVRAAKPKNKTLYEKETDLNADFRNLLIHGDCLSACAYLKSKNIKVDLVYIDPPFASGANYAKSIYLRKGGKSEIESDDTTVGEEIMYGDIWQKEDYLNWLYERLLAIRDIMSETASIYVHLDWHIGHYVKLLMDEVFGEENFLNEVIWCYGERELSSDKYNNKHDNIYFYAKDRSTSGRVFNCWDIALPYSEGSIKKYNLKDENGRKYQIRGKGGPYTGEQQLSPEIEKKHPAWTYRDYFDEKKGILPRDWFSDITFENRASLEQTYYNNQKPYKLLERIIKASSDSGMLVADFFSGSGTTAKVAHDLNRKFIACDIGVNAIQTARDRLAKAGADFDILKIQDGQIGRAHV